MRLLNVSTFQLEEFNPSRIPPYAILSHTWDEGQEVLYSDVQNGVAETKPGYRKIRYSCVQSAADGLQYVWIDTCCIDKSSSAELSEAINSMYSWYTRAKVCYAYLSDVSAGKDVYPELTNSRWFTRGWTLQELIAPIDLLFFSKTWQPIGTKITFRDLLAQITGISTDILTGQSNLQSTSIARRMSWASHRETSRPEDMAYCLMGIFDVNMPMLYGEGEKAFIRLQEEIMKNSDDQSLFAWTDQEKDASHVDSCRGLLARHPQEFADSGWVQPYVDSKLRVPYTLSNQGLRIDMCLHPSSTKDKNLFIAVLSCQARHDPEKHVGVYLRRLGTGSKQYARVNVQKLCETEATDQLSDELETIYVRQSMRLLKQDDICPVHVFQLRKGPTKDSQYALRTIFASERMDDLPQINDSQAGWMPHAHIRVPLRINKNDGVLAATLFFQRRDGRELAIMLGSTSQFQVGYDAMDGTSLPKLRSAANLQMLFKPKPVGDFVSLDHHTVHVNTETIVFNQVKYYLVDIDVEAKSSISLSNDPSVQTRKRSGFKVFSKFGDR